MVRELSTGLAYHITSSVSRSLLPQQVMLHLASSIKYILASYISFHFIECHNNPVCSQNMFKLATLICFGFLSSIVLMHILCEIGFSFTLDQKDSRCHKPDRKDDFPIWQLNHQKWQWLVRLLRDINQG